MSWALFVEGDYDEVFVRWLLGRLGVDDVEVTAIRGGVSHLRHVVNQIRRSHDEGRRVALLLDADTNAQQTGVDLATEMRRLCLPVERSFLLPDDTSNGKLETLLEQMAHPSHQAVYRCCDDYAECLRSHDPNYSTPGSKARVYAYCEAVGAKTTAKKDYDDPTHWDRDAPCLEPLREFLRGLVDPRWGFVLSERLRTQR